MNILIIQEAGRHEKNKEFRESLNLNRAFNRIEGISSKVWGLNFDGFKNGFDEYERWADVILVIENYTSSWMPLKKISDSKKLKLFWSIDSHCVLQQHMDMCKVLNIDVLLNSTESYIPYFKNLVKKSFWFPNAYPSDLIDKRNIEKTIDIGFCGNYLNRKEWIDYLDKYKIKKDIFVIGEDMVKSINSFKIHFNRNISNDINYRTFETTGCGTLLLTNYTPGLEKLFDIDKDILVYKDKNDLDRIVKKVLNEPEYRKQIEISGYNKSKNNHTYDNRSIELVKKLNQLI